jgi:hypothetical protein
MMRPHCDHCGDEVTAQACRWVEMLNKKIFHVRILSASVDADLCMRCWLDILARIAAKSSTSEADD